MVEIQNLDKNTPHLSNSPVVGTSVDDFKERLGQTSIPNGWYFDVFFPNGILQNCKTSGQSVDISELSSEQKSRINHILTQNFPLIEIFRLVSGDTLSNVNISGIKQINEVAGQEFCDKVLAKFKEILRQNIGKSDNQTHRTRIVKDDYKNFAFVSSSDNPFELIFSGQTKSEIIEQIIDFLSQDIEQNARKILKKQISEGKKIDGDFEELVIKKVEETKQIIRNYFDFGFSFGVIPEISTSVGKLDFMRKIEISSRPGKKSQEIISKSYDEEENLRNLHQVFQLEAEIIEKYKGQKFSFRGVSYNAIFNNSGEYAISSELLKYVRKYPDETQPQEMLGEIKKYISLLNISLDYIAPIIGNIDDLNQEFTKAKEINDMFHKGLVNISNLFVNFKGGLTKQAFSEAIKGKKGHLFSIDIKDMGIENILDFRNLAKKIIALEDEFNSGRISKESYESQKAKMYLEAGKTVTDKFVAFQNKMILKYPKAIYRIGGDEIELFISQKTTDEEISQTTRNLSDMLESSDLKSRIVSYSFEGDINPEIATSNLEKITKVGKILEEEIGGQLSKENKIGDIPNNVLVYVNGVGEEIMQDGFDFEEFFKQIKKVLSENDLKNIFREKIIEIGNGFKLKIIKNQKGQLEVYLLKS